MKESGRSGEHSGAVVKKKSSSGCLIIKKKGDALGMFTDSSSRNYLPKEKKRPRLALSDSGSSDELLEPVRRKVVPGHNGSVVYKRGFVENREFESGRKINGLDVFEFDEYDGFDGKNLRRDSFDDRLKFYRQSGDQRESGSGTSSRVLVDKRKHPYYDTPSGVLDAGGRPSYGIKSRFEMEDDEAHLPISSFRGKYREPSDEPIRLQGKNGVLKVMVNKNKHMGMPRRGYDHLGAEERRVSSSGDHAKKKLNLSHKGHEYLEALDRKGSRSEDFVKMKAVARPSFYSDSKRPLKPVGSLKMEKSEPSLQKKLSVRNNNETDDSDTSLKLAPSSMRPSKLVKVVKSEANRNPPAEDITPVKGKESKVKRGSGTEKQLLREKIRNMLLAAGWTIDYRPRRNRDYLDAVYINPSGTAYWSIIKAYEALQKQSAEEEDNAKANGEFTPLPDEILSKLTRQTRKKMEREMKKKRRDEGSSRSAKKARVKESAEGVDSDPQEERLSSFMKTNRKLPKSKPDESGSGSEDDSSDNLYKETAKQDREAKMIRTSNSHMIQGRKSRKIGRCTLLVRSSDKGLNSENDGFVPYKGKRTLLSWLIDSGTVHMSEKVQYMNRRKTRVMLEGWITRDGIHCGCCSKILTVLKFELHAGSKLRQPFANIFLQSGQSLLQCQLDAWNKQVGSECQGFHTVDIDGDDPNDDTCGLCGDGGDLICCDGCPSTFHLNCLDIQMLPPGDWHCPNCACKFCRIAGGNHTDAGDKTGTALLTCCLCEKKYHESCSQETDEKTIDCINAIMSFCGHKCQELYSHLQKLLGVKHELDSGFSWSLIHRSDPSSDTSSPDYPQRVECNSKLAIALTVMDECFLPIADRRSGIKLINNVVYNCGSNFSRLNYNGFYTAILERGDEIICAASIRIHGTQLAEMPFIGTRHIYRRQGMCRRLLSAIESALSSLQVETLIIPAIAEHMHTWTDVFGFSPLEESLKQAMRSINMLVFPGTDMLQKRIEKHYTVDGVLTRNSGNKTVELDGDDLLTKNSNLETSDANETEEKVGPADSSSQDASVPVDDDGHSLDAACEAGAQSSSKDSTATNSLHLNKAEPEPEAAADIKSISPSNGSPIMLETGNPMPGSPGKPDIELPILENKSKVDSLAELDLNACNHTGVKNDSEANDRIADTHLPVPDVQTADKISLEAPCEPELQSSRKESISSETQMDSKLVESSADVKGLAYADANPVVLEIGKSPSNDNVQSLTEDDTDDADASHGKSSCCDLLREEKPLTGECENTNPLSDSPSIVGDHNSFCDSTVVENNRDPVCVSTVVVEDHGNLVSDSIIIENTCNPISDSTVPEIEDPVSTSAVVKEEGDALPVSDIECPENPVFVSTVENSVVTHVSHSTVTKVEENHVCASDSEIARKPVSYSAVENNEMNLGSESTVPEVEENPFSASDSTIPENPVCDLAVENMANSVPDHTIVEIEGDPVSDSTVTEIAEDPVRASDSAIATKPVSGSAVKNSEKNPVSDSTVSETAGSPLCAAYSTIPENIICDPAVANMGNHAPDPTNVEIEGDLVSDSTVAVIEENPVCASDSAIPTKPVSDSAIPTKPVSDSAVENYEMNVISDSTVSETEGISLRASESPICDSAVENRGNHASDSTTVEIKGDLVSDFTDAEIEENRLCAFDSAIAMKPVSDSAAENNEMNLVSHSTVLETNGSPLPDSTIPDNPISDPAVENMGSHTSDPTVVETEGDPVSDSSTVDIEGTLHSASASTLPPTPICDSTDESKGNHASESMENEGNPVSDSTVMGNEEIPLSDSAVVENEGNPEPDSIPVESEQDPVSDSTVMGNEAIPLSDSAVVENEGNPEPDSIPAESEQNPVSESTVMGNEAIPLSDSAVVENEGNPEPDSIPAESEQNPVSDSAVMGNEAIPLSDSAVVENEGNPEPDSIPVKSEQNPVSDSAVMDEGNPLPSSDFTIPLNDGSTAQSNPELKPIGANESENQQHTSPAVNSNAETEHSNDTTSPPALL